MIAELDETIKQLLIKKGKLEPAEVDISFETPDRQWSASISKPRINIYLYDIRENHGLRGTEWMITRDRNGGTTRKKNASRIDLSYLITVWTNDIADEHRLLWHVLLTLFRHPELPGELLSGQLAKQDYPIRTITAQPDGLFNNPADFWTALDNKLKPSINYIVTMSLDLDWAFTAPMVKTKTIKVKPPDAEAEELVQIGGTIYEAGKSGRGIAEARVVVKETGMTAESDGEGHYSFPRISAGKHTFEVTAPGRKPREASVTVPSASYDLEV